MNPPNPSPVGNRGTRHEPAKPATNWDGVRHKGPQIASQSPQAPHGVSAQGRCRKHTKNRLTRNSSCNGKPYHERGYYGDNGDISQMRHKYDNRAINRLTNGSNGSRVMFDSDGEKPVRCRSNPSFRETTDGPQAGHKLDKEDIGGGSRI